MTIRGGLRSRFTTDSVRVMVLAALVELGWFDAGRQHAPITFAPKPQDWDVPVAHNTFSVTPEWDTIEANGLGDDPAVRTRFYVDFWGQDEAVATHFMYDVRDALLGLNAGRTGPTLDIFDFRVIANPCAPSGKTDPVAFTKADIVDVRVDRPTGFPREWQRHWIVISFWLEDDFLELSPTAVPPGVWSEAMWTAWNTMHTVEPQ